MLRVQNTEYRVQEDGGPEERAPASNYVFQPDFASVVHKYYASTMDGYSVHYKTMMYRIRNHEP